MKDFIEASLSHLGQVLAHDEIARLGQELEELQALHNAALRLLKKRDEALAAANRRAWRHLGLAFEADYSGKGWEVFRVHRPQTRRVLKNWNSDTYDWLEPGDRAARLCNYWGREPEE